MCRKLLALLLMSNLAAAVPNYCPLPNHCYSLTYVNLAPATPLLSNSGEYCTKEQPARCMRVRVQSIASSDGKLNQYADGLISWFRKLDRAGLERWAADLTNPENEEIVHELSQEGESANYRLLSHWENKYAVIDGKRGLEPEESKHRYHVLAKAEPQKPLSLDEILLPQGWGKLVELQREAFSRALRSGEITGKQWEPEEYFKTWPFRPSYDWNFHRGGLNFLYNNYGDYEISYYPVGVFEITVPLEQLQGVVKPEFLREMASWRGQWQDKPLLSPEWRGDSRAAIDR